MRNLQLVNALRVGDATELSGAQDISVDYDTKVIYIASGQGVFALDPVSQQVNFSFGIYVYTCNQYYYMYKFIIWRAGGHMSQIL